MKILIWGYEKKWGRGNFMIIQLPLYKFIKSISVCSYFSCMMTKWTYLKYRYFSHWHNKDSASDTGPENWCSSVWATIQGDDPCHVENISGGGTRSSVFWVNFYEFVCVLGMVSIFMNYCEACRSQHGSLHPDIIFEGFFNCLANPNQSK